MTSHDALIAVLRVKAEDYGLRVASQERFNSLEATFSLDLTEFGHCLNEVQFSTLIHADARGSTLF